MQFAQKEACRNSDALPDKYRPTPNNRRFLQKGNATVVWHVR